MLPGMGLDPVKMAAMQDVSQHIKGVITIDYEEKSVKLVLSSAVPEAAEIIPDLVDQLGGALAQQLTSFFAIKGEITEVNKPSEKS